MARITGNNLDNVLNGTGQADTILGLGGHDALFGFGGNDTLDGGTGNDTLVGGAGSDSVDGGDGNDILIYRASENFGASDLYSGGKGTDTLRLVLTSAEAAAAAADISAFQTFLTQNSNPSSAGGPKFTFTSLGLTVRGVEQLQLVVINTPPTVTNVSATESTLSFIASDAESTTLNLTGPFAAVFGNPTLTTGIVTALTPVEQSSAVSGTLQVTDGTLSTDVIGLFLGTNAGNTEDRSASAIAVALYGFAGADTLTGGAGNDTLVGGIDNDTLTGGAGDDTLVGGVDNDTLDGGNDADTIVVEFQSSAANDTMRGGDGIDTLRFDGSGSEVLQLASFDSSDPTGTASGSGIEFIDLNHHLLVGTNLTSNPANDDTTFNFSNTIFIDPVLGDIAVNSLGGNDTIVAANQNGLVYDGNLGDDTLIGGTGNDTLSGGAGNDTLTGAAGNDSFLFAAALTLNTTINIDQITDFVVTNDTILLDNAVFTSLTSPGTLAADNFAVGGAADADDFILYDVTTGALSYDSDGNETNATQVQFATLDPGLAMTNDVFSVV